MKRSFLGDLHYNPATGRIADAFKEGVIQVGDLSVVGYSPFDSDFKKYFLDGNHDHFPSLNPDGDSMQEVARNLMYIPRGYVSGKVMFIGGADSIDRHTRFVGNDWWPEEAINYRQVDKIMRYTGEVEVIVAHGCPLFFMPKMMNYCNHVTSAKMLDIIFEQFRPKLWICGHHHKHIRETEEGCHFAVLGIEELAEFDVPLGDDFS